jgi:hypothetical protein
VASLVSPVACVVDVGPGATPASRMSTHVDFALTVEALLAVRFVLVTGGGDGWNDISVHRDVALFAVTILCLTAAMVALWGVGEGTGAGCSEPLA